MPEPSIFPGADERSPSRAQYFSWINNTNEGATEAQTRANLKFFAWLREEFGMQLDVYAFDAGAIDGASFYGKVDSERFRRQFPRGFGPLAEEAAAMGCRLGIWCGPDGFGDTPEAAAERTETMVALCRDHRFALFKMDAVCGQLRPEKRADFARMMTECRRHSPDLILLNHRLELGEAMPHATTFLFEGAETYIDVHMANSRTAPHSRAVALERGLVPGLRRLTEDHGVCLSSCLDYWEDDLVLQAFNRCLILAPELYGNPWLLRDDEYPRLARLFNLHRTYRDILVDGIELPDAYGPLAVARGSENTRLLTLRNLTWEPVLCRVRLDAEIGLEDNGQPVHVRRFHPHERICGEFAFGGEVEVEIPPFRSLLLLAANEAVREPEVRGCDFDVVKDGQVRLLGMPGTEAEVTIANGTETVVFAGTPLRLPYHRKLAEGREVPVPADARAIYEATCFAADNNALEYRELERSGPTRYEAVQAARDAFFNQPVLRRRHLRDRDMFDDDPETAFATNRRWGEMRIAGGAFRLDLGETTTLDRLEIDVRDDYDLQPFRTQEGAWGAVSDDLVTWHPVRFWCEGTISAQIPAGLPVRYVVLDGCPDRIWHVRAYRQGHALDRSRWRASNLFALYNRVPAAQAWEAEFVIEEAAPGSVVAIAVNGIHGVEGATAAIRSETGYQGASRRTPSFVSNTWECPVRQTDRNNTFLVTVTPEMIGRPLQAVVLLLNPRKWSWSPAEPRTAELKPEVWLTCYPTPYVAIEREIGKWSG